MKSGDKTIQYWVDLSEYDLGVAETMLENGHYLYVGFMCHQSVEKMLKAVYVYNYDTVPPFIHKLDKLIELAGLGQSFGEGQLDLIDELTPLNIQARYPAYKEAIYKLIGKEKAKDILERTGELVSWLKASLK
jgi:HEPN domain-containing protein